MRLKAAFPFILSFLLLSSVILIDRSNFNKMTEYTAEVDRTREVINRFERLSKNLKSAQIFSRNYVRRASPAYYSMFYREAGQVKDDLRFLRALLGPDTAQQNRLRTISRLIERHWDALMQKNIAEIIASGEGYRIDDLFVIHTLIDRSIAYENSLLSKRKEELQESTTLTGNFSALFSILALGIVLGVFASQVVLTYRRKWLEGFLESILNSTRNGIVNLQPIRQGNALTDFRITFSNAAFQELVDERSGSLVGRRLSQLPGWMQAEGLGGRFKTAMETGAFGSFEYLLRDGERTLWMDVLLAQSGDNLTATLHNITTVKQYQQELQEKVVQLDLTNRNLQEFAYVASHDLQEPLRKIQAFGDILERDFGPQIPAGAMDLVGRMQNSAERMSALIKDLLTYSRLSSEQTLGPVALSSVLVEVTEDLELLIADQQAVLHIAPLPTLSGDPMQLHQLFHNLLSNALKFNRDGVRPEISITCRRIGAAEEPVVLSKATHPSYYRIEVTDNGIGFDMRYADQLFQLFRRLHGKSQYSGTGIGLAICKKVVDNHHGFITAEGRAGQGATFTIYLPA
ncbi:sensor histidine kinase [Larkinella soli]|uniref:sensor histidine kinase n=1 Tax=Larkinella soli TaxID=1770527 RepID=UPI000FFC204D|nr:ATP-binding protein [Larkinella soli]